MMIIKVIHKQSLLDLSIQAYGSINEVFALAVANNMSVTTVLSAGASVIVPLVEVSAPETQAYYLKKQIKPATALANNALEILDNNNPCDICALFI